MSQVQTIGFHSAAGSSTVAAAKPAREQLIDASSPITNKQRVELFLSPPSMQGSREEVINGDLQRSTIFTTLLMRQQTARTHAKVSKPVRPQVTNAFEGDTFLAESVRSEAERGSCSAIATEKVSSPTVIRNKDTKTMSGLQGAKNIAWRADSGKPEPLRVSTVGRNGSHLTDGQRLFQRQEHVQRPQTHDQQEIQSDHGGYSGVLQKKLAKNLNIFKTMATVVRDERDCATRDLEEPTASSQSRSKTRKRASHKDSCTVSLTKNSAAKCEHMTKDQSARKSQDSFSIEPKFDRRGTQQGNGSHTLAEQILKGTKCARISSSQLKKRRNNSTVEMDPANQPLGTNTTASGKLKGGPYHCRVSLQVGSLTAKNGLQKGSLKAETSPAGVSLAAVKLQTLTHKGGLTAKEHSHQTLGSTNAYLPLTTKGKQQSNGSKTQSTRQQTITAPMVMSRATASQDNVTFSSAANLNAQSSSHYIATTSDATYPYQLSKACKTKESTATLAKATQHVYQTTVTHMDEESSSLAGSSKLKTGSKQQFQQQDPSSYSSQKLQQLLLRKDHPEQSRCLEYNSLTKKQPGSRSAIQVFSARLQPDNNREQFVYEQKQSALSGGRVVQTEQNNQQEGRIGHVNHRPHLVISRNSNQAYNKQQHSSNQVLGSGGHVEGFHSGFRLMGGSTGGFQQARTSKETAGLGGTKKEIKCVITKQTKFNEERLQQQNTGFEAPNSNAHSQEHLKDTQIFCSSNRVEAVRRNTACKKIVVNSESARSTLGKTGGTRCPKIQINAGIYTNVLTKSTKTSPKANMQLAGKQFQPVLATAHIKKDKGAARAHAAQSGRKLDSQRVVAPPDSADKTRDKQHRRQIVQKIKNQLIQAFDTTSRDSRFRHEFNSMKNKSQTAIELATSGQQQPEEQSNQKSKRPNMLKTFDQKLSSPVLKCPPLFTSTPSREQNPYRPQKYSTKSHIISTGRPNDPKRLNPKGQSDRKRLTKRPVDQAQVFEHSKLEMPKHFQKSSRTLEQHFESPIRSGNSNYESQLSAPQEISSPSQGTAEREQHVRGVKLPQTVAKATKEKLSNIELSLQLCKTGGFKAQSRNLGKEEVRFSQRIQRTLPSLAATDDALIPSTPNSRSGSNQEVQLSVYKTHERLQPLERRRNTVFSDTRSTDLMRQNKPTFMKPQVKGMRQKKLQPESASCASQGRKQEKDARALASHHKLNKKPSIEQSSLAHESPMQPDTDEGKHIPPASLAEEIQLKAKQRNNQLRKVRKPKLLPEKAQKYSTGAVSEKQYRQPVKHVKHFQAAYGLLMSSGDKNMMKQTPTTAKRSSKQDQQPEGYETDINRLNAQVDQFKSPSASVATTYKNTPAGTDQLIPVRLFSGKVKSGSQQDNEDQESLTNGGFSDSQFGEIAEEEVYMGVEEKDPTDLMGSPAHPVRQTLKGIAGKNNQDAILCATSGRPAAVNLGGRYTQNANKKDTTSYQNLTSIQNSNAGSRRLITLRGNVSLTEGGVGSKPGNQAAAGQTAKEILLQKGSKCKCSEKTVSVCSNFCKHLSSRQQKKIVKKLLLENFKQTIENALESKQKLTVAQLQNPFILQANFGCLADRKFLVSASWWSKWCDYVNFTADEHGINLPQGSFRDEMMGDINEENDFDQNPFQGVETADMELEEQQNHANRILRLSIYQQSSFATLAEAIENDNEQSQLFYERPGCIENGRLLETEGAYRNRIKGTVVERFDYEVVPHAVWQHLYSWYSADVTICRKLVIDPMNNKGGGSGHPQNPFPQSSQHPMMLSAQESGRQQQYRVILDLFPQQNNTFGMPTDVDGKRFLNSELDELDEPSSSHDTTNLLYQQQIEDHSSSTHLMPSLRITPEDMATDSSYYRHSTATKKATTLQVPARNSRNQANYPRVNSFRK